MPALKETARRTLAFAPRSAAPSLSQMLVVAQIAISLLMLVAAGLFVRTLSNLQSIQLGFNRENVLLFEMNARQAGHRDPEIVAFYSDLQKRFRAIPGVRERNRLAFAAARPGLLDGRRRCRSGGSRQNGVTTHILMTGSDFFTTMQIPIVLGRAFDERDQPGSPPVAVVSEAYVQDNFGDRNPLGAAYCRLGAGRRSRPRRRNRRRAANLRYGACEASFGISYTSRSSQDSYYPVEDMTFALRTSGDPLRYAAAARDIVHQADARVPVTNVKTQAAQIDQMMNQEIIFAQLCTAFAILALRSPASACTARCRTPSRGARRRSGSGWRWERTAAPSSGWCCARSSCWRPSGSRSACRWRWAPRDSSSPSFSE